mgnify:CR=1 FL=1
MDVEEFRARARAWLAENAAMVPGDWGPIVPAHLVTTARALLRQLEVVGATAGEEGHRR